MANNPQWQGHEKTIEGWEDFCKYAESVNVSVYHLCWAFRGQADSSWSLTPTFLRICQRFPLHPRQALYLEELAVTEFRRRAHLHVRLEATLQADSLVDWWGLMQHHGAPTRLLDWTYSPFVAAYFAAKSHPDRDGAIWCLDADATDRFRGGDRFAPRTKEFTADYFGDPEAPPTIHVIERQRYTDRIVAQQSCFTVCRQILADHAEPLALVRDAADLPGLKMILPKRLKTTFLQHLRLMNITAATLFPGIDGLGQSISEQVYLRAADSRAMLDYIHDELGREV